MTSLTPRPAVLETAATLVGVRDIGPEVRHFEFEVPGIERFAFIPGQFVAFTEQVGGKRITRAYSIASPPAGNRFELCLNRVKEGHLSPHLFSLQSGDSIAMKGPMGDFVLRRPASDSVFVATGTGIAPFRSMLRAHLSQHPDKRFTLVFGVRYREGLLYGEEFEVLAAEHPNFRFWPTLTRPPGSWQGRTGRVQPHLVEAVGRRRDIDVYICGLEEMVDDVRKRLKEMGFERSRVVYEKYD